MQLEINTKQLQKFCDKLITIKEIKFPNIIINTINTYIFESRKYLVNDYTKQNFKVKTNFIKISLHVDSVYKTAQQDNPTQRIDYNKISAKIGQYQFAGKKNTKTLLENTDIGKPAIANGKYTPIALSQARTGKTFNKTVKKENKMSNVVLAKDLLKDFTYKNNDETKEFVRIRAYIASRNLVISKPILAHTKTKGIGIYSMKVKGLERPKNNNYNDNITITKLYTFKGKTTNIKKRLWFRKACLHQLSNLDKIYKLTAKRIFQKDASNWNISLKEF